ncbi:MAG: TetM/TetW/TetO/TetS family tetracycline resistance ribosomal protection protein [Butyrivibrio sp.]|jgi:small GTP-binding protein|nr:TetM/TetW/TetO/TetS family tetracycline resistance ribosomal protection protein [Butyrivibrio sp.]
MNETNLTVGILAHVDAGKTTLSEGLLYLSGVVRKQGRVDHGDAFLDTYDLEKSRGITIFSKQAVLEAFGKKLTLLDTPGHADFSPEMERTLQVLDAGILVISAADGINGQVRVLWRLLQHYNVPVFLFVNKMDQPGADHNALLAQLKDGLDRRITDFSNADALWNSAENDSASESFLEDVAVCDEYLLTAYLAGQNPDLSDISRLIQKRELFPCFFGSALKMEGVERFLRGLSACIPIPTYPDKFGARVFKISRDDSGKRLSFLKITGGTLKVRDTIPEKVDQIRIYSGARFSAVQEAPAGTVCAVTGLSDTHAGDGLGAEPPCEAELLQPILNCRILLTNDEDPFLVYQNLKLLEEEEPMLHITRQEETGDLYAQVMGRVQMEILRHLMQERFSMSVDFGPAAIVYRETIAAPVEGVGHFEPLRHYAEVHLLMEPTGPGTGLSFAADCSPDQLAVNWQRLVLTHLEEKKHTGVLTGSEITDMKITLIAGRASIKHTEGGDFRQATYRAVRQGLMMADSILLEPVLDIRLEVPSENLGRALTDLQRMSARTLPPETAGGKSVLTGTLPAACLGNYAEEIVSYTRGEGHLSVSLKGYEPCHNPEEVIENIGYQPDLDPASPSSSVFCSHGVGTIIPWDQVRTMMHVDSGWKPVYEGVCSADGDLSADSVLAEYRTEDIRAFRGRDSRNLQDHRSYEEREHDYQMTEKELSSIFERTYGPVKPRYNASKERSRTYGADSSAAADSGQNTLPGGDPKYQASAKAHESISEYLLVDGYNVLYASEELHELAVKDLKAARDRLMDILSNFQGYRRETVILVFDAYRVSGGQEKVLKYHNLDVVYTKEAETADQYIEKAAHDLQKKHRVTVATSDGVEQVIIYGSGALRLSARDFWTEIKNTEQNIRDEYLSRQSAPLKNYAVPSQKEPDLTT